MAIQRANPYGSFNFLVDLGTGNTSGPLAGFQECSGLSMEVTVSEYRNGNDAVNHVRKTGGIYKAGDVTLKRGLIGVLDMFQWMSQVRAGDQTAHRNVVIHLLDEAGKDTVMAWRLINAWPTKYTGPSLNAKSGTDVAVEELVLTCEDIVFE